MTNSYTYHSGEIDWWTHLKQGDPAAYHQLYETFMPQLYNYGSRFSKDNTLIEDAIHDLFYTLWASRTTLSTPVSVKNYLFKALRTTIFKKLKNNIRTIYKGNEESLDFNFELSIDETIVQNEKLAQLRKDVEKALSQLTPRQKEVIYYRFYLNMEFQEIADIMEMQVRATYKLTARALETLRISICPVTFIMMTLPSFLTRQ